MAQKGFDAEFLTPKLYSNITKLRDGTEKRAGFAKPNVTLLWGGGWESPSDRRVVGLILSTFLAQDYPCHIPVHY